MWMLYTGTAPTSLTSFNDITTWMQTPVGASTTALVFITFIALFIYPGIFSPTDDAIHRLRSPSALTGWSFLSKRHDFLASNFQKTGKNLYQFRVLQHAVVAVRGEEARKTFYNSRSLNFTEGYKIFRGGIPKLEDIDIDTQNEDSSWFIKHILVILHKDRLSDAIPILFEDVNNRMMTWGTKGQIDPFKDINDLVFQMTVRMTTCQELSDDRGAVSRLRQQYQLLMQSSTPTAILFPWLPGTALRNRVIAMKELYTMLQGYIKTRRSASVPTADAIDVLISKGLDNGAILEFILGVVFAGVVTTGVNTCWLLIFLAANPVWKQKVTAELTSLIQKHTTTASESTSDALHKHLSLIPLKAWEDELPALDLVIRETLRLTVNGAALRRNVLQDFVISGKTIKKGVFLTHLVSDVHMDPEIYPDPETFDPGRFGASRADDKKGTSAFLGWGAGRHPCAGTRIAKLEIKIIVSLFLTTFEYDLVDGPGNPPHPGSFPKADRNDPEARPLGEPCYLRFRQTRNRNAE